MVNVTEIPSALHYDGEGLKFLWYDYVFVSIMLAVSGGLGIFFGCCNDHESTAEEYLLGGKKMKVIPVALSLMASHTSGVTLLGVPADVYAFGATYLLASASLIILAVLTVTAFIPVFYNLQVTSTYEYLGLRFDGRLRKMSSFLFALSSFIYLPMVVYLPALAFSAATGIDVHIITPVVCGICIFYTSIGGLKALVWIDTIQFTVTFGIVIILLALGITEHGGISHLWNLPPVQERMSILDFSTDLTKRETALALLIGFTTHVVAEITVNQGYVQKFLSVPSLGKAKWVILIYCIGMATIKGICVILGLVLSATYANCDPLITNKIKRSDQMLPHYVLDVARNIPGLSGLFTGGILTASLRQNIILPFMLSGSLNSLSGTIYEDFLKESLKRKGIENEEFVLKTLVIVIGVIGILLVYVVENMGGILSLAIGLGSVAQGPLLGMFLLGLFFPTANATGTFYGVLTTIIAMTIIITGNNFYKMMNMLRYPHKTISVDSCNFFVNRTVTQELIHETVTAKGEDIFPIFRISFYWCTLLGSLICVVTGLIISHATNKKYLPVSKKFLSPIIYSFLSKNRTKDHMDYQVVQFSDRRPSYGCN